MALYALKTASKVGGGHFGHFFGRYGPRRLRLQLSVPTKLIETNKHKKTTVKQRSELLKNLLQHADLVGYFFCRYGPRRLRLQLSVPTKPIETNKHKKTAVKQRSELFTACGLCQQRCSATRRSSSQRLSRSDSGSAPKATQDGAQDQDCSRRSGPVAQHSSPSCFLRVVHTEVQGELKRSGEPQEATPRLAGARTSHTLRGLCQQRLLSD